MEKLLLTIGELEHRHAQLEVCHERVEVDRELAVDEVRRECTSIHGPCQPK